jgi:uncharacterized protein YndB with AHSA1/START domain
VEIERPAAAVFPWLLEPERLAQWIGGLVETEPLTEGEPRVGSRSREVVEERGRSYVLETELTALEPGERLEARITSGAGFTCESSYRLDEREGRTRLTCVLETEYKPFVARLFAPLVTRQAQRKLESDLARLKELVEAS